MAVAWSAAHPTAVRAPRAAVAARREMPCQRGPAGAARGAAPAAPAALALGLAAGAVRRGRRCALTSGAPSAGGAASHVADAEPADSGLVARRKIGVLLLNIGTPTSTSTEDVRDYLGRFLGDDRVIDIEPAWLKWFVLQILLAVRPAKSAENYKRIWDEERGSPLQFHTEDLVVRLQQELGEEYDVRFAFQYSPPFTPDAVEDFTKDGVDRIVLVPMFPQYASSTVGTCLAAAYTKAASMLFTPFLSPVPPFYAEESWRDAVRENISKVIGPEGSSVDHTLFSFHGLPVGQCTASHRDGKECNCQVSDPLTDDNQNCYRAQCHDTARRLAADLGLKDGSWSVGFQSRLTLRGAIQWVTPYTDVLFEELAAKGVRRLAIVAPSFTMDCIETLEELGISGQEEFREAGGEELLVVPCVNSSESWAAGLSKLIRRQREIGFAYRRR